MTEPGKINPAYEGMAITQDNFPRYKTGANFSQVSKIKKYTAMGYGTNQIAHMLGIVEACIVNHVKGPRKKPGPKPKVDSNE